MTPALSEIIERVEGATGPDRELDAVICQMIMCPGQGTALADGWVSRMDATSIKAPAYTSSLDAALTLKPQGHAISLHVDADGTVHAGCMKDDGDGCDDAKAYGATPALGLLEAILRARLATQEQQG